MRLRKAEKKEKSIWNALVQHPLQTWEWADAKESAGTLVDRLLVIEQEKPIAAFLVTYHSIAAGKLLAYCGRSTWPTPEMFQLLKSHCKARNCIALKLEPDIIINEAGLYKIPLLHKKWHAEGDCAFVQSKSTIMAQHTFIVDLLLPEKTLLNLMKSKTRYNIKLAEKKGVTVSDTSDDPNGFTDFFSLYNETLSRQKYYGRGKSYLEAIWNEHKRTLARIYTAFYEKKPLASYMVFFWKNRAFYVYGGSSEMHKDVMASNALMWSVICDAKKRGLEWFDMWGALASNYNKDDHWAGFHRFKEGYNPTHTTYLPPIDLVIDNLWYTIFDIAWPIRNKLLQLMHVRT